MVNFIFIIPVFVSFFVTLITVPYWIRRAHKAELVGKDMHKLDVRLVADLGGVPVLVGFLAGAFTYIGLITFYFQLPRDTYALFAMLNTVLIAAIIGIIDDILGWKIGLRQWQKPLLTLFAALPMVVVNAGYTNVGLPLFGSVELSYIYPFLVVPIGIIGATNGFNLIGGYNGLEAGIATIILVTEGLIAYLFGKPWLTVIAFSAVAAIIAFLIYNKYPARIFPGNTFTYMIGALIASIAIFGDMEKIAILLFVPYIVEIVLKSRGLLQKESFAKVLPDGTITKPYDKWYGIEHMAISLVEKINRHATEQDVVRILVLLEILLGVIAIAFVYFRIGIF